MTAADDETVRPRSHRDALSPAATAFGRQQEELGYEFDDNRVTSLVTRSYFLEQGFKDTASGSCLLTST
jgi:hypothetical protein